MRSRPAHAIRSVTKGDRTPFMLPVNRKQRNCPRTSGHGRYQGGEECWAAASSKFYSDN